MKPRLEQPAAVIIRRELEKQGATITHHAAAELTGINVRNAREYLNAMHEAGEIHIRRWARNAWGPFFPVYAAGEGDDAPRPDTRKLKAARRRARRIVQSGSIAAGLLKAAARA